MTAIDRPPRRPARDLHRPTRAPETTPDIASRPRPGGGPLYAQVRAGVIQRIVAGIWKPGALLPSETRLAEEFGVSQGTVRKALDALAAENLVLRQQGKGTFVAAHTPERALFHFFKIVGDDGSHRLPTGRVLSCARRRASQEEAQKLNLAPGAKVVHIQRVRDLAGRPAIVEKVVVPARLFPDLGQSTLPNTLYKLYEETYGVIVAQAVERLKAVAARRNDAALLDVPIGAPLLEIERIALTLDRTPVEWRVSRCDTRSHHYWATVV
jgi:GntR family transcriptional regulator